MVEWQTCMMFMCACVHHVFVLEIDLCGSTARALLQAPTKIPTASPTKIPTVSTCCVSLCRRSLFFCVNCVGCMEFMTTHKITCVLLNALCIARMLMVEWQTCMMFCACCMCVPEIDWCGSTRALLQVVSDCSSFVCPPCSSCAVVSRVAPAGSSWARVLLGSCVFLCRVSSLSRGFVWVVCMMVAVMEHKHGMWVWGLLLAACVLRCVAKIVMVEWQTCMMFMCACVHHVFVLEIDLCGSTARALVKCVRACSSFVCPPCSSCVRVCCCFSRGACWIELGARAAWIMYLSVSSVVGFDVTYCAGCGVNRVLYNDECEDCCNLPDYEPHSRPQEPRRIWNWDMT